MLIDNELFAGRIVRLPRTGKDWAVLIIAIVIWFLLSLLFEKKLSNMKREHRRIVEAVCMFVTGRPRTSVKRKE